MQSAIGCVVVTYNRVNKLKKALASYDSQTAAPQYVLVVDNASTDGTAGYLEEWQAEEAPYRKIVKRLASNTGGSGGFYEGQKAALEEDAGWIMLADDDAYLAPDYIETIQQYISDNDVDDVSVVCGTVVENGNVFNPHRRLINKPYYPLWNSVPPKEYYQRKSFYCDVASYIGSVISKDKLQKAGLVNKEYFIWYDDLEHALRLRKLGKFVCLPGTSIEHDIEPNKEKISFKKYYGIRNHLDLLKQHFPIRRYLYVILYFGYACYLFLSRRKSNELLLQLTAIKDGILGRKGIHYKYKPGWKA